MNGNHIADDRRRHALSVKHEREWLVGILVLSGLTVDHARSLARRDHLATCHFCGRPCLPPTIDGNSELGDAGPDGSQWVAGRIQTQHVENRAPGERGEPWSAAGRGPRPRGPRLVEGTAARCAACCSLFARRLARAMETRDPIFDERDFTAGPR